MTVNIYTGFDTGRTNMKLTWDTTGAAAGSFSVTYSTGTYAHRDLTSVMGAGEYDDFAGQLKSDMDTQDVDHTYTVTWSNTNLNYTLEIDSDTFSLDFTTSTNDYNMGYTLGFYGDQSAATAHTSAYIPYYLISTTTGGISETSPYLYSPPGMYTYFEADDGTVYGQSRTTHTKYFDFTVPMEDKAQVFVDKITGTVYWTWEDLFEHAATIEPLLLDDQNASDLRVLKLRGDCVFQPRLPAPDWTDYLNISLRTVVLGSL